MSYIQDFRDYQIEEIKLLLTVICEKECLDQQAEHWCDQSNDQTHAFAEQKMDDDAPSKVWMRERVF